MRSHFLLLIFHFLLQARLPTSVVCLSQQATREILDLHNYFREVVSSKQSSYHVANMNQLEWSDRLSTIAAGTITCHSSRLRQVHLFRTVHGNVNVGRRRYGEAILSQIVKQWFAEKASYLPEEGECYPWDGCNNYKTMINARHRVIGCATVDRCGRYWDTVFLMCIYEGGEADQFQFQIGPPCSGCSQPLSFCQSNLCVSCNRSTEQCDCRKSCMKAGIGAGQLNTTTCACTCYYGDGPNCDQPCQNRVQYVDYDICDTVSPDNCDDPRMGEHFRTFCAEVCSCKRPPSNATEVSSEM